MTIALTPLCYAYLAGSIVLFAIWLVFFLLRRDLHKEMLAMSVLIGVLSVLTGYVWWTVDWWKPPTITHTIVGVEDLVMGFAAGGIMAAAYEVLFRRHLYHVRGKAAREASRAFEELGTMFVYPDALVRTFPLPRRCTYCHDRQNLRALRTGPYSYRRWMWILRRESSGELT
jgi:hypothetical protein